MTVDQLCEHVRAAWAAIPTPPEEDMSSMAWVSGEAAVEAFVGVAPMDVDIDSPGFMAATPLLDLPARAAAAYLGPYLVSLLRGLQFQESVGLFDDFGTRAHTLACLTSRRFWRNVIHQELPPECRAVVIDVATLVVLKREMFGLNEEDIATLRAAVAGEL